MRKMDERMERLEWMEKRPARVQGKTFEECVKTVKRKFILCI